MKSTNVFHVGLLVFTSLKQLQKVLSKAEIGATKQTFVVCDLALYRDTTAGFRRLVQ